MNPPVHYRMAADAVLYLHAAFVVFVILGLVLIIIGRFRDWLWVRNLTFRIAHLAAIAVVVLQAWLGQICPLTALEMSLRAKAGDATYAGSFVAHWVEEALYYSAPLWVFAVAYTIFGALVVGAWFWVKPTRQVTGPSLPSR